jgi:Ca2+-binding RTX toxin-like protein
VSSGVGSGVGVGVGSGAGADAHASSDRILYNSNTGQVFYDSDGTGAAAKVQFAQISPHLNITHNDFYVI